LKISSLSFVSLSWNRVINLQLAKFLSSSTLAQACFYSTASLVCIISTCASDYIIKWCLLPKW